MDVTVAICTWNRARLLDQTLLQLRSLTIPADLSWELIVVDNNCTDATSTILRQHESALPLRVVVEKQQGHSHARNRAVIEARGRLLFWIDDDVLVHADWMKELYQAAEQYPSATYFGGTVRPWFESPPPDWVKRHLQRIGFCWALVDHGPAVRPLLSEESLVGANLAFRTEILRRYPFDPEYGRVGNRLTSGDESRVIESIRDEGGQGVWVGSAIVDHLLPNERMTAQYVFEINRWAGYHGFAPFASDTSNRWRNAPRWLWKRYFRATITERSFATFKNHRWINALLESAKYRGLIDRFQFEAATNSHRSNCPKPARVS